MMKTHHSMVAALLLIFATCADAQNADPLASPAATPQNEMQKWIATTDAQWQAVFAREVTAPFEAEEAKLWQQYLAGIESGISKATAAGNLELAVAWRNEREHVASAKAVAGQDEPGIPAVLKQLRTGWHTQIAKIKKDREDRAKALHARYDQVLAQAQTQLTQRQRIDDALLVKAKREETAAAWLGAAQPGNPPTRPAEVQRPATPVTKVAAVPLGARLAEKMNIHASGNNGCIITINGKQIGKVMRDKPGTFAVRLHEGDVIAVKLTDRFDINSFWMSCIASTGEFLFETSEQWSCYLPGDDAKWWDIKNVKKQQPARFAPEKQEYVDLVKTSAAQTPLYAGAQPIRSDLNDGSRITWIYYVVTKADLVLKQDRKTPAK
jgi:hypothetical protein